MQHLKEAVCSIDVELDSLARDFEPCMKEELVECVMVDLDLCDLEDPYAEKTEMDMHANMATMELKMKAMLKKIVKDDIHPVFVGQSSYVAIVESSCSQKSWSMHALHAFMEWVHLVFYPGQSYLLSLCSLDRAIELDYHLVEFDDVHYHIQASSSDAKTMVLSIALPAPPPEAVFSGGIPFGAVEAVKTTYGPAIQIIDPAESGFHMTLKLDLSKLPPDEDDRVELMIKVACLRAIVLGAPLRDVLKHLAAKVMAPEADRLMAVVHRPKESFFVIPQPDKVTIVFPMRFKDSNDSVLATSFLQEFMEARRAGGLNTAPACQWSPHPPIELKGAPAHALDANSGFVSFVILPRHVEGEKLDTTVWSLCTFHAYVSYHVKEDRKMNLKLHPHVTRPPQQLQDHLFLPTRVGAAMCGRNLTG
ncbi:hypothetical protein GOP47_0011185 [Adiantum capillus-veneris]|uniref:Arp2/3 complex 34 kDa subunit n=1 Tax=Adiantum capillus-veneris TaxID=13818 RepID=A0A9D4USS2_ADICA|nr:hypothetical protein GOP47_0011185 [Adiantum capillus-veneris]